MDECLSISEQVYLDCVQDESKTTTCACHAYMGVHLDCLRQHKVDELVIGDFEAAAQAVCQKEDLENRESSQNMSDMEESTTFMETTLTGTLVTTSSPQAVLTTFSISNLDEIPTGWTSWSTSSSVTHLNNHTFISFQPRIGEVVVLPTTLLAEPLPTADIGDNPLPTTLPVTSVLLTSVSRSYSPFELPTHLPTKLPVTKHYLTTTVILTRTLQMTAVIEPDLTSVFSSLSEGEDQEYDSLCTTESYDSGTRETEVSASCTSSMMWITYTTTVTIPVAPSTPTNSLLLPSKLISADPAQETVADEEEAEFESGGETESDNTLGGESDTSDCDGEDDQETIPYGDRDGEEEFDLDKSTLPSSSSIWQDESRNIFNGDQLNTGSSADVVSLIQHNRTDITAEQYLGRDGNSYYDFEREYDGRTRYGYEHDDYDSDDITQTGRNGGRYSTDGYPAHSNRQDYSYRELDESTGSYYDLPDIEAPHLDYEESTWNNNGRSGNGAPYDVTDGTTKSNSESSTESSRQPDQNSQQSWNPMGQINEDRHTRLRSIFRRPVEQSESKNRHYMFQPWAPQEVANGQHQLQPQQDAVVPPNGDPLVNPPLPTSPPNAVPDHSFEGQATSNILMFSGNNPARFFNRPLRQATSSFLFKTGPATTVIIKHTEFITKTNVLVRTQPVTITNIPTATVQQYYATETSIRASSTTSDPTGLKTTSVDGTSTSQLRTQKTAARLVSTLSFSMGPDNISSQLSTSQTRSQLKAFSEDVFQKSDSSAYQEETSNEASTLSVGGQNMVDSDTVVAEGLRAGNEPIFTNMRLAKVSSSSNKSSRLGVYTKLITCLSLASTLLLRV